MSVLETAADVAGMAVPGVGQVRLALRAAWKIAPWIAIALLAGALLLTRGTLDRVEAEHKTELAEIRQQAAEDGEANARKAEAGANSYAARTLALLPLINRSKETVTLYAQTPAGRAPCLAADRVHGIDELDAALFTAPDPAGAVRALHPDAGTPPAGRISEQR